MQKIQIKVARLWVSALSKLLLLGCVLCSVEVMAANQGIESRSCSDSQAPAGCYSSSSGSSSNRSSNSQANTQAAIGAVQAIAGVWETQRNERIKRQEQENAAWEAKKAQERAEFNRAVSIAENDATTNPWANSNSDKKEKKQDKKTKPSDIYLGNCVEQNFSMRSDGQFALKNICNYAINVKYIFSASKPFSGTYTTLRPNEVTFATGKQGESVKYYMCPVPQTPQTLDGGCI